MTYIYIMSRKGRGATLSLALPSFKAAKIEQATFTRFSRYRVTLTPRRREGWIRQQIKVGISTNPRLRVQQVDSDLFGSGRTEWIQAGPVVRLAVYLYVLLLWMLYWLWLVLLFGLAVLGAALWIVS